MNFLEFIKEAYPLITLLLIIIGYIVTVSKSFQRSSLTIEHVEKMITVKIMEVEKDIAELKLKYDAQLNSCHGYRKAIYEKIDVQRKDGSIDTNSIQKVIMEIKIDTTKISTEMESTKLYIGELKASYTSLLKEVADHRSRISRLENQ
jgi:hypothetical protein